MQSRNGTNLRGIDISNHQGIVDFVKVKSSGVQIVYMKASESNFYRDIYLDRNYQGAKAAGLLVGFYHFFRGDVDPKVQAQFFVNSIAGKESDCRLMLDLETNEGLNSTQLSAAACIFLQEVIRLTSKGVVVYTYTSFARSNITSALGAYPVWIADYVADGVIQPHDNPIWKTWIGFQYASDGKVPGVNGDCDVDEFTSDILLNNKVFNIHMTANIQNIGFQNVTGQNDVTIGTTGKGLRMESIEIDIDNGVTITADAHVQNIGTMQGLAEGQMQGTIGQALRLEAVIIHVKEIPSGYKLQYCAHVQNIGWMPWVESGQIAGTEGKSLRMEALRVRVVKA
ncbi:MAG: GH25 family lysozyme [Clostridiaceae bacterium]